MKDDATKDGVSEEKTAPETVDPRQEIIDSIVKKHDEQLVKDEVDAGIREPEKDDEGPETEDFEEDSETKDEDEPKDGDAEKEPDEEMVEVVVDGKTEKVPLSKILDAGKRTLQKETTADQRLEEATRLLKEAKEVKPPPKDAEDEKPKKMTASELAYALQYGTQEEAETAMAQIISQGQTRPKADPDDIKDLVKKQVEEANNTKAIVDRFNLPEDKGGFGDITTDPYLMDMAIRKVNEKLADGSPNTWETYQAAGNEVRGWMVQIGARKKESSFEDKKQRKRSTDVVKSATAIKADVDKEDKPKTASQVIREMAAARPGGG